MLRFDCPVSIKRLQGVDLCILVNLFLQLPLIILIISLHSSSNFWIDERVALSSEVVGADASDTSTGASFLEEDQGALDHVDDVLLILNNKADVS